MFISPSKYCYEKCVRFFKMIFKSPSRSQREKRVCFFKMLFKVLAIVMGMGLISFLFLSGFNYLEDFLGWKKNIVAGLITGPMAAWILLEVIIRYIARRGLRKLYDKLSMLLYSFLFISLLMAFLINFGWGIGICFALLTTIEAGAVYYRQASASKKKSLKRKLPWIFYR